MHETDAIRERYLRRESIGTDRYSRMQYDVLYAKQERQRAIVRLLRRVGIPNLHSQRVLEVGCGLGDNLLELLELGAMPENLIGNDLLEDRVLKARSRLPQACQIIAGDCSQLPLENNSFDVVYQSTVFTSILDRELQQRVAAKMWNLLKNGGGILWYDFTYNNPKNLDVKGVTARRVQELFPNGKLFVKRVTLAPPLSRLLCRLHPSLYAYANMFPFLRTHILAWISKPIT